MGEIHRIAEFVYSIFSNWVVLVGGPIVTLIGVGERIFRKEVHWRLYVGLLATLLVCSFYISWRDARVALEAKPQVTPEINVNERDPQARAALETTNQKIETLESQLKQAREELKSARPPFVKRLRECLDSIDPRITETLKTQRVLYQNQINTQKIEELKKLSSEANSSQYFSLKVVGGFSGAEFIGGARMGVEGVELTVERKVLEDENASP